MNVNIIDAEKEYVMRMLSSPEVSGMKILLLDAETAGIVSLVCSKSAAVQKEVYLFEKIEDMNREAFFHMKCVAYLRPTQENIIALSSELRNPKYKEYHIFFSNELKDGLLRELAQSDEHEVVKQVQEFYGDYYAINPDFFTLYTERTATSLQEPNFLRTKERIVDGITSVLLSLRKKPIVRYDSTSDVAQTIARELDGRVTKKGTLFDFRGGEGTLVLVLDRHNDPITPLLFQWTYQAMVHEIFGLNKNIVELHPTASSTASSSSSSSSSSSGKTTSYLLSPTEDAFYRANMHNNYGDLGNAVKGLVDEYKAKSKANENISTLDDIKDFFNRYPEFRRSGANASMHVTVLSELNAEISRRLLIEHICALEQELACDSASPAAALRAVTDIVSDPRFDEADKLRLVLLYTLRYGKDAGLTALLPPDARRAVDDALRFAGPRVASREIFGESSILERAKKSVRQGLTGIENVYTRHQPFFVRIVSGILTGDRRIIDQFPLVGAAAGAAGAGAAGGVGGEQKISEVIVFYVGGANFEEAVHTAEFNSNQSVPGVHLILGSTNVLNSKLFIQEMEEFGDIKKRK